MANFEEVLGKQGVGWFFEVELFPQKAIQYALSRVYATGEPWEQQKILFRKLCELNNASAMRLLRALWAQKCIVDERELLPVYIKECASMSFETALYVYGIDGILALPEFTKQVLVRVSSIARESGDQRNMLQMLAKQIPDDSLYGESMEPRRKAFELLCTREETADYGLAHLQNAWQLMDEVRSKTYKERMRAFEQWQYLQMQPAKVMVRWVLPLKGEGEGLLTRIPKIPGKTYTVTLADSKKKLLGFATHLSVVAIPSQTLHVTNISPPAQHDGRGGNETI